MNIFIITFKETEALSDKHHTDDYFFTILVTLLQSARQTPLLPDGQFFLVMILVTSTKT
jgi:hypothetical protein